MMPTPNLSRCFAVLFGITFCQLILLAGGALAQTPANAKPDVGYVGTQTCIACHQEQYQSYLETKHSVSMVSVDPDQEQLPAKFYHKPSMTDYEVFRKGDQMIHREIIRGVDGQELVRNEHPVLYTIGSGTHGKGYIFKDGDFLGQSPVSWYQSSKTWDVSPGYDVPFQPGFGRILNSECFFCHVGDMDRKQGNPNVFHINEVAIGCERCHGPGEAHVAHYQMPNAKPDETGKIVNPEKLDRVLSEAICQQCHLQAAGKALLANKDDWDYRPGLPLTDFRVDYQYKLGDDSMRVVGHIEQLHMSECYTKTDSLTCITCHDPHHTPPPEDTVAFYRAKCLSCHQDQDCGETKQRRDSLAGNDCAKCHMPQLDTEVPHTAFRHHRIGIHRDEAPVQQANTGLASVLSLDDLSALQKQRTLAIAKYQVSQEDPQNVHFRDYGFDAARALIEVKNQGKGDAEVNTVLSLLAAAQRQPTIAKTLSEEVLEQEKSPKRPRVEALRLLAQMAFQRQDYETAVKFYREVTTYQLQPFDFFYLALCEQSLGNPQAAITALNRAASLAPNVADSHRLLAQIYTQLGQQDQAAKHSELANQLQERIQALQAQAAQ